MAMGDKERKVLVELSDAINAAVGNDELVNAIINRAKADGLGLFVVMNVDIAFQNIDPEPSSVTNTKSHMRTQSTASKLELSDYDKSMLKALRINVE